MLGELINLGPKMKNSSFKSFIEQLKHCINNDFHILFLQLIKHNEKFRNEKFTPN